MPTTYDQEIRIDPETYGIDVIAGEALTLTLPILHADGTPVPLDSAAGWEVYAQIRPDVGGAVLWIFDVTHTNAIVTAGAAAAVVLTATGTVTEDWQDFTTSTVRTDVFVTDPQGAQHCLAEVTINILPSVTRENHAGG